MSGTLAVLALSGCSTPGPAPASSPTTAVDCPADGDATEAESTSVVGPGTLCRLDGRAWRASDFTLVLNTPLWKDSSESCDEARKAAWIDAWSDVQESIVTIDLDDETDESSAQGSVGIAVIDDPDAAAAVAALDAEVDACLVDGGDQTRLENGEWRGLNGPNGSSDDIRWTWWTAVDDRWALVQVYALNGSTEEQIADLGVAVETVLDAQRDLLDN